MGHFGRPCGAHGGTLGAPCDPCGAHLDPWAAQWAQLGAFGSSWWVQVAPFRSLLAPFGRILVTFVEGLGDFLEAFPGKLRFAHMSLSFLLSLFPFSALPVPLLRQFLWLKPSVFDVFR